MNLTQFVESKRNIKLYNDSAKSTKTKDTTLDTNFDVHFKVLKHYTNKISAKADENQAVTHFGHG